MALSKFGSKIFSSRFAMVMLKQPLSTFSTSSLASVPLSAAAQLQHKLNKGEKPQKINTPSLIVPNARNLYTANIIPKNTSVSAASPSSSFSSTSSSRALEDARSHYETRVVPFVPEQLYNVVSDVDNYSSFVPWCTQSQVTRRVDDQHVIADLSVGFRYLSETYTSVLTLDRNRAVSADVPNSSLFDYLITDWTFEPYEDTKTKLAFYVEFRFRNPLYRRVTDLFFEEVVRQMVGAFERQCHRQYNGIASHNDNTERLQARSAAGEDFHRW